MDIKYVYQNAIEDINFRPFQSPLKFTQSVIFGLKMYHLATLTCRRGAVASYTLQRTVFY
jgi:hypothetical protein